MPPRPLFDFGACSCPLPQGLDRLGRCAASLGDQGGSPSFRRCASCRTGDPCSYYDASHGALSIVLRAGLSGVTW